MRDAIRDFRRFGWSIGWWSLRRTVLDWIASRILSLPDGSPRFGWRKR